MIYNTYYIIHTSIEFIYVEIRWNAAIFLDISQLYEKLKKKNATYILSLSVYYYNKLQNFFFSFVIINIVGVAVLLFNLFPIGPKYVWYFSHA